MTAKDLTQEQREWFVANFDHTKNQELADHLGVSLSSVIRKARELGLTKTKEFIEATQRNASECAARTNRLMGGNAGKFNLVKYGWLYRFKKGENNKDRMTAEAFAEMHRKIAITRKETFNKERRRVLFGIEQRTKLRVVKCSREKISLRANLRKHGYEIARASNEATVTSETQRSLMMEARAEKMGIKFNFLNK